MSLTVKEKEHWKERIGKRIDSAVEKLKMSDSSGVLNDVEEEALKEAQRSLGLTELIERMDELDDRKKELNEQLVAVDVEMRRKLGVSEARSYHHGGGLPHWIQAKINDRAKVHRTPLLLGSQLGRNLLKLEREKEELLDTVWLSTSSKQIKQLWAEVAELLKSNRFRLIPNSVFTQKPLGPRAATFPTRNRIVVGSLLTP